MENQIDFKVEELTETEEAGALLGSSFDVEEPEQEDLENLDEGAVNPFVEAPATEVKKSQSKQAPAVFWSCS